MSPAVSAIPAPDTPALLARLRVAADGWHAAPYGGVVEYDAANELYGAAMALLDRLEPPAEVRAA